MKLHVACGSVGLRYCSLDLLDGLQVEPVSTVRYLKVEINPKHLVNLKLWYCAISAAEMYIINWPFVSNYELKIVYLLF